MATTTENTLTKTVTAKPCNITLFFHRSLVSVYAPTGEKIEYYICKCVETRVKTKILRRYKFHTMDNMQKYIDEQVAKVEREVARREERKTNKVKRNYGKVKITEEYTLYYNGIRRNGEKWMVVKGSWSIQNREGTKISFYSRGYSRIPSEIGAVKGCVIRNDTDSMTDYFDTDTLIITEAENKILFDMVMQAFKQGDN